MIVSSSYKDLDLDSSDRLQQLHGVWQFQDYSGLHDLNALITEDFPSMICGVYTHTFLYETDAQAPKAFLNLEGAESCFSVWLNGEYLGYGPGIRTNCKFDVTEKLVEGENVLAVLAGKSDSGNFRKSREMLCPCCIFDRAYLLKRPEQHIRDYFVTNLVADGEVSLRIMVSFADHSVPVAIKLLNADNNVVAHGWIQAAESATSFTHQAILRVKQPILWNPEAPYLYTLLMESPDEVIVDRVAIRQVCVDDNKLYLNGHSVKLAGVRDPKK